MGVNAVRLTRVVMIDFEVVDADLEWWTVGNVSVVFVRSWLMWKRASWTIGRDIRLAQLGFGSWIARTFNKVGTQAAELKNMMSWQTHTHSVASNSVKNDCLLVANLRFHTDFKSFGYQSIMSVDARIASYLTRVSNSVHAFRSNVAGDAKARPMFLASARIDTCLRWLPGR